MLEIRTSFQPAKAVLTLQCLIKDPIVNRFEKQRNETVQTNTSIGYNAQNKNLKYGFDIPLI